MIILKRLGGFDEDFFLYSEDTDLCWRLKSQGLSIRFIPDSLVYHMRGRTAEKLGEEVVLYHSFKNRLSTILKNLDFVFLPIVLPIYLSFVCLGTAVLFLSGEFKKVRAIWSGTLWNLVNISKIIAKRKEVIRQKRIRDWQIQEFHKSIPVTYLFSQLLKYLK